MRCPGEFPGKISSITSDTIHSNNTQGSISQLIAPEPRYPLKVLIKHSRLPPPHILITTLIHNILKYFNKMWNLLCIINQWWWNNGRWWRTSGLRLLEICLMWPLCDEKCKVKKCQFFKVWLLLSWEDSHRVCPWWNFQSYCRLLLLHEILE